MTTAELVERALQEDVGSGDITTELCVPAELRAHGRFIVREPIVVAGLELMPWLYDDFLLKVQDGDVLQPGDEIATVQGSARLLLTRERVALNFLQHLSGIATLARKFVDCATGTHC